VQRNRTFDIMLFIGISAIVLFHLGVQIPGLDWRLTTFQIPLFYFISGYFCKRVFSPKAKGIILLNKIKKQLIPFFALAFLLGIITFILHKCGFSYGYSNVVNFQTVITDWLKGEEPYRLYGPAWFLLALFFVNVVALFVFWGNKKIDTFIAIISIPLILFFYYKTPDPKATYMIKMTIRILIGFLYFSCGALFKMHEEKIKKFVLSPVTFILALAIISYLQRYFGIDQETFHNSLGKDPWASFIAANLMILVIYIFSSGIAAITSEKSIIYVFSQSTFSIMVWHYVVWVIFNIILFYSGIINYEQVLDRGFIYERDYFWIVYYLICMCGSVGIRYLWLWLRKQSIHLGRKVIMKAER